MILRVILGGMDHQLAILRSSDRIKMIKILLLMICINLVLSRCPNYCSGHGKCGKDAVCECYPGWGSQYDVTLYRSHDCSTRVCMFGISWGDVPDYDGDGHPTRRECSDIGICDRSTGLCKCPHGYTGRACEKRTCPNDCSGN